MTSSLPEREYRSALVSASLLTADEDAQYTPLDRGVSSETIKVRTRDRQFVIKRPLRGHQVKDDGFIEPSRPKTEQSWFDYVARFAPSHVPRLLHRSPEWFAMEFLGSELVTWKDELFAGKADFGHAATAGSLLASVHLASRHDQMARSAFGTQRAFHEVRIAPYLLATGQRLPSAREHFEAETERLGRTMVSLVHGDFSPRNILVGPNRLIVLDAEVACFGDPAFDLALLLTHFHLKAVRRSDRAHEILALAPTFWRSYQAGIGWRVEPDLEARVVRLVLLLVLTRVHGKSPVEYLYPPQQAKITAWVVANLPEPPKDLSALVDAWETEVTTP